MATFREIEQYTDEGNYHCDVELWYLEEHVTRWTERYGLDMDADFQRAHVWDEAKQVAFVEHLLRGGQGSHVIRLNSPGGMGRKGRGKLVVVDGKQRLTACLRFIRGEITAFGSFLSEYVDPPPIRVGLSFYVNDLQTRAAVLRWYLEINEGGVVHTEAELSKVRELLIGEEGGE